MLCYVVHERCECGAAPDIADLEIGATVIAFDLLKNVFAFRAPASAKRHVRAGSAQTLRDRGAYAAGRAGHERSFVRQIKLVHRCCVQG